jgi:hypothetical protein
MADTKTVPITIRFPADVYERLRKAAFDGRMPMNSIVVQATEAELEAQSADEKFYKTGRTS